MLLSLLFLTFSAFAQIDLSAIQELDEELPDFRSIKLSDEDIELRRQNRNFRPPIRKVSLEEIEGSGLSLGALKQKAILKNIKSGKRYLTTEMIYVKYFNLEDEHGQKYIMDNDGNVIWVTESFFVEPIKEALALYEPPLKYTPAPKNIVRAEYDRNLTILPEIGLFTGVVQGDYFKDLFNDNKAQSGRTVQYALHFFSQWNLPLKAGVTLHYEQATFNLSNGGRVLYSSPSFGPQFKTREFNFIGHPVRFQTQFRVSPFARAFAETSSGEVTFNFNSADLLASFERPIKNRFGEFVLGIFFQSQWLSLKNQTIPVEIKASNETNKSFGLSLAQVFE